VPERTRKFLRKRLDAYENKSLKKDERYWRWVSRGMNAMDDRPTLRLFFYVLLALEFGYWLLVLTSPKYVLYVFNFLSEWSDKGIAIVIGLVFGTGLWLAYILFRFRIPDLENHDRDEGPVLSSYAQSLSRERLFRVWVIAVVAGLLNVLLLVLVASLRGSGWNAS
jgi:hypothetical protein